MLSLLSEKISYLMNVQPGPIAQFVILFFAVALVVSWALYLTVFDKSIDKLRDSLKQE